MRGRGILGIGVFGVVAAVATMAIAVQVVMQSWVSLDDTGKGGVPTALTALVVFGISGAVTLSVSHVRLDIGGFFPWLVGTLSVVLAGVPLGVLTFGSPATAAVLYRGMRLPQGIERFWDLALVIRSVDCASWGFDVYVDHNGCLQDASIYGPGSLWLQYVPGISYANTVVLGVIAMALSSAMLVWLARQSAGLGRIVLLCCAAGAPWLLLLERGNFDAFVLWSAVLLVFLVRRWPDRLWPWFVGGAGIWLMGTFKYYPFALLLMLLPVLRLRRGWTVLAFWVAASVGYVLLTWENFRFSAASNAAMVDMGDYVVLGRIPVVARMGLPMWGDLLVVLLALSCAVCGAAWAMTRPRLGVSRAMLAVGGAAPFLAAVLVAGFGWAYKAAFLFLCVPLLSAVPRSGGRALIAPPLFALICVGLCGVVVWNTMLATLAGIVAASFALGAGGVVILRSLRSRAVASA